MLSAKQFVKCCKRKSVACLGLVTGMGPDVEDFFVFRFKIAFLTSSGDTDLKWKLSHTISG